MKTNHGIFETKKRSVLAGFAVILMAEVFTLAACGDAGGGITDGNGGGGGGNTNDDITLTWTAIPAGTGADQSGFPYGGNINGIVWGSDKFVAGGDKGKILYSRDGINWTAVTDSKFGTTNLDSISGITYGNGRFIAVGYANPGVYSDDGINWTAITDSTYAPLSISGIAWGNDKFIAFGSGGKMMYSGDGTTWTAIPAGTSAGQSGFPSTGDINGIAWDQGVGKFVAVGHELIGTRDYDHIAYSGDGIAWQKILGGSLFNYSGSNSINSITWGSDKFVAVGTASQMAYSGDGIDWTAIEAGIGAGKTNFNLGNSSTFVSAKINDIAWGNGVFVAAGASGCMAYSGDGTTWTAIPAGTGAGQSGFPNTNDPNTGMINGIAYGNGRFVAVGDNGTIAYSNKQE
jgi:hypothetical protein